MKVATAHSSGMRGAEKHVYHPNQNPETPIDTPVGEQAGASAAPGVTETPKVFSSGMRGAEKPKVADNPLESEVKNENQNEALKGLPAGSEVIGKTDTHHIVKVPKGKGTTKAVPA
jgi:hypothetical protein